VRFADWLLRRHLSEAALTRALLAGERPGHLTHCAECAERAEALGRWLERLATEANAEADQAFPPERLAVQQAQILRQLEQVDEPVRVLEFPASHPASPSLTAGRGVAPGWVALAAAAGLVVGIVGTQMTAGGDRAPAQAEATIAQPTPAVEPDPAELPLELFDPRFDLAPATLRDLDEATPSIMPAQYALR